MPVGQQHDFRLAGKGYMLQRGEFRGRAWHRTGRADTPGTRSAADAQYGALPDEIDHAEVWDDWSGGYGSAYRRTGENLVHWSENFDLRFPRQAVHCQALREAPIITPGGANANIDRIVTHPVGSQIWPHKAGESGVMVIAPIPKTQAIEVDLGLWGMYLPTGASSFNYIEDPGSLITPGGLIGRPGVVYCQSLTLIGQLDSTVEEGALALDHATGAWTEFPIRAKGFALAGNQLWRYHGPNHRERYVQCCAIEASLNATANWSATLSVGGQGYIRDMIALDEQLYCGMLDGLYAGDQSGSFFNVVGDLAVGAHQDNFRDLSVYEGGVVAPYAGGLLWYLPNDYMGVVQDISPAAVRRSEPAKGIVGPAERITDTPGHHLLWSNRSAVRGQFRCAHGYAGWLYAGLWTGSYSYILAGRPAGGGFRWHVQQRLPTSVAVSRIYCDGITTASSGAAIPTRLWIATDPSLAASAPLYYVAIPMHNDNPLVADPVFTPNYGGSARMDFPASDWDAPSTPKIYRSVEVWADHLAASAQYADVYYTIDEGTRTKLGSVYTSPKTTLYFPSGEGSFVTGQSIALSLESFTYSATVTPVYRAVVLRGALRPRSVDVITAVVRIGDNLRDRRGGAMRAGAAMLSELRALANQSSPVQLVDLAGATAWVNVLRPVEEQEVYQQGENDPEIAATVRMAVQEFA